MDFKQLLTTKPYVVFDGAMGTMLQQSGLQAGDIPELLNLTHPDHITEIHRQYVQAGAQIVYTNTFGANRYKLHDCGSTVTEVVCAGMAAAKKACRQTDALVALDIGPIGQLLEPTGSLSFESAVELFSEMLVAGKDADLVVFETFSDLYELKAAVLAAKEHTNLPIVCTMTYESNHRTFTGTDIRSMALTLEGLSVDAIGINCSLGPKELAPLIRELCSWTNLPVVAKPNAGLPDPGGNGYQSNPSDFADEMCRLAESGVRCFGGCCGTTPAYITSLCSALSGISFPDIPQKAIPSAVCSASQTVVVDRPRIIGERVNPTGKKRMKEALLNHDMDYILNQAIEQVHAGAAILDVNVGVPSLDEAAVMAECVKAIQSITDTPLQLDSSSPAALEAGLRVYNGKPIVNSVNGKEETLTQILPLVKKYGAAVVGLTLDENGIPSKAEERFAIAERIVNKAVSMGICREDVYIDCLTLTASAEQAAVMETLKALRMVKERLGVKTVLGVSNISFGLPCRETINHTFLAMALTYGLDLPIINPNIQVMSGTVRAFSLLKNIDINSTEYIAAYGGTVSPAAPAGPSANTAPDLAYCMENGLKNEGARLTKELLATTPPMDIVNNMLIPALDKAGALFEQGKIFLPQLILTASVAQVAFEEIKNKLSSCGEEQIKKGKIVLATVKDDIHDIGKNIVKVLLENYGYDVIDLGRNVEPSLIVETTIREQAPLVGLSALMTTTVGNMEHTIQLLKEHKVSCKVMVGGAVLTPDYAKQIGADFYSRDAKESVDIAKEVLG